MSVANLSNFINGKVEKLIHTNSEKDVINQIRSFLFKNYIKTVVEAVDDNADGFRMMFIANRFKSDFKNPITKECNGAIFYYSRAQNKFFPLVIPAFMFNSQKLVKSNIHTIYKNGKYDVYPVLDGTVMNLYNYKGKWCISTNKAYDATSLVMYDDKTYMDVFNETLNYSNNVVLRNYIESISLNDLECNCISMCVKNEGFHIFKENFTEFSSQSSNRITIIQQYIIDFANQTANKVEIPSNSVLYSFTNDALRKNSVEFSSWKDLNNNINNAITTFKKMHNRVGFTPFLGVILRAVDNSVDEEYKNILIESNLMSKVRNFLYNFGFSKNLTYKNLLNVSTSNNVENAKSYYNMLCLNRLHIFLNRKDVNLFISLFPHFKKEFAEFNHFFSFLTTLIMKNSITLEKNLNNVDNILNGSLNVALAKLPEHQNNNEMDFVYKPELVKLCMIIVGELNIKQISIPQTHEGWNMLNDFIISPVFLDYYYSFMFKC